MKMRTALSTAQGSVRMPRSVYVQKSGWCERILVAFLLGWVIVLVKSTHDDNVAANGGSQVAVIHPEYPKWQNKNGIVHILSTRFMQMQPNLLHLGKARLELFATFTFASVQAQSTKDFLWIIATDPKLDPSLLDPLVELLKPHDHIILLGTNTNFQDFPDEDDWMNSIQAVFSGDLQKLVDYQKAAKENVFLETRLDADDAIFRNLMSSVQLQAKESMIKQKEKQDQHQPLTSTSLALALSAARNGEAPPPVVKETQLEPPPRPAKGFRIFCAPALLEWGYFNPWEKSSTKGHLYGVVHDDFCVTPGLTYAYQVGTRSKDLPTRAHHKISKLVPVCGGSGASPIIGGVNRTINCMSRIAVDQYPYAVLRSRTPTSTAMLGVIPTNKVKENTSWRLGQDAAWSVVEATFGVSPQTIFALRNSFQTEMTDILQDALDGQCTRHEFTCKDSTSKLLHQLLDEVKQNS